MPSDARMISRYDRSAIRALIRVIRGQPPDREIPAPAPNKFKVGERIPWMRPFEESDDAGSKPFLRRRSPIVQPLLMCRPSLNTTPPNRSETCGNTGYPLPRPKGCGSIPSGTTSPPLPKMAKLALKSPRASKANSGRVSSRSGRARTVSSRAAGHGKVKEMPITFAEFDRLAEAGKDYRYNKYFGPPMTPAEFRRYLKREGIAISGDV
jgi:hypothetical protein